jgi:hypothetical protein
MSNFLFFKNKFLILHRVDPMAAVLKNYFDVETVAVEIRRFEKTKEPSKTNKHLECKIVDLMSL